MNKDLERAKIELLQGDYTCVLVNGENIVTSTKRGVAPLLGWLEEGIDLRGYSAADKVVGRGAAMLYALMEIKVLYAAVLSEEAKAALKEAGIEVYYGELVPRIQNRTKTGYCPMEEAVLGITDPEEALVSIKKKLEFLRNNQVGA